METLWEDSTLMVERLEGGRERLVVVMSGIGHGFGGIQRAEFVGTASNNGKNTVLFVTDRTRSWFSAEGVVSKSAELVSSELERLCLNTCYTIGNSMGGYGAIRMTIEMPVAVALAFSPQFSMNRAVIDEPRWDEFRPAINFDRHLPLSDCIAPGTRHYAIFGGASAREVAHCNLLPKTLNLTSLLLPGGGHNIVQLLKETGNLVDLVDALFDQDTRRIEAIQEKYSIDIERKEAKSSKHKTVHGV